MVNSNNPAASGSFRVRIAKDYLQFCVAHCILREDGVCEPLHGHNYRVAVCLSRTAQRRCWHGVWRSDYERRLGASIEVEVEETPGQAATYTEVLSHP